MPQNLCIVHCLQFSFQVQKKKVIICFPNFVMFFRNFREVSPCELLVSPHSKTTPHSFNSMAMYLAPVTLPWLEYHCGCTNPTEWMVCWIAHMRIALCPLGPKIIAILALLALYSVPSISYFYCVIKLI
jgi:hypothetical protein